MSNKDNGGPAFPLTLLGGQTYKSHQAIDGMTLRDYFAAKAMQAVISHAGYSRGEVDLVAECSYDLADAMLQERAK